MEYTGQTLFMSEEVSTEQCHIKAQEVVQGEIKSAQDNGLWNNPRLPLRRCTDAFLSLFPYTCRNWTLPLCHQ